MRGAVVSFDPYELRVGVVLTFASAAQLAHRPLVRTTWHWVPVKEMGVQRKCHDCDSSRCRHYVNRREDRSFEKRQTARRVRVKTLQKYKNFLQTGARPCFKRPCDWARARLWRVAADSLGIDLGDSP